MAWGLHRTKLGLRAYMLLRQRTVSCGDALRQRKRVGAKGSKVWGRDQETPREPMEGRVGSVGLFAQIQPDVHSPSLVIRMPSSRHGRASSPG